MPRIFDKYMAREFIPPFLGCVAGFTFMLLSGTVFELMDLIFTNRMSVTVVGELLLHSLPKIVVVTLPIGALFATLLSLGRLVRDSELGAIRSAGVSFRRAAIPVLMGSILVSCFAFIINEHVVPYSEHRAQNLIRASLFKDAMPNIEENVFFRGTGDRFFYVGRVDPGRSQLFDVLIYETEGGPYPSIISAESGTFAAGLWHLRNGVSRTFDTRGHTVNEVRWQQLEYRIPDGDTPFFGNQKTTDEMTRKELKRHLDLFERSGIDVKRLVVEYHMKLAMPFASFLWVFMGAPLSLRNVRSARVFGVIAAILITFAYFVISALFRSLGDNGILPPLAAAWMTNALFFSIGLWLNVRADRA